MSDVNNNWSVGPASSSDSLLAQPAATAAKFEQATARTAPAPVITEAIPELSVPFSFSHKRVVLKPGSYAEERSKRVDSSVTMSRAGAASRLKRTMPVMSLSGHLISPEVRRGEGGAEAHKCARNAFVSKLVTWYHFSRSPQVCVMSVYVCLCVVVATAVVCVGERVILYYLREFREPKLHRIFTLLPAGEYMYMCSTSALFLYTNSKKLSSGEVGRLSPREVFLFFIFYESRTFSVKK